MATADSPINRYLEMNYNINLFHTQLIDPCNNGFIVFVNYLHDYDDTENRINIQLVPIDRKSVTFLTNYKSLIEIKSEQSDLYLDANYGFMHNYSF